MPSKKYILNKIKELENDLIKLKSWAFEHYAIDSLQENTFLDKQCQDKTGEKAVTGQPGLHQIQSNTIKPDSVNDYPDASSTNSALRHERERIAIIMLNKIKTLNDYEFNMWLIGELSKKNPFDEQENKSKGCEIV